MNHWGFNRPSSQPDGLADAPLDAVTDHRAAHRARHGKPDAGTIGSQGADAKRREERTGKRAPSS